MFILVTYERSVKPKPPTFAFVIQQTMQVKNKHTPEEMIIILGAYKVRLVGRVG